IVGGLRLTDLGPLPWYLYPLSFEPRFSDWKLEKHLSRSAKMLAVASLCTYLPFKYVSYQDARLHNLSSKYAGIVLKARGKLSHPPRLETDGRLRIEVVFPCPDDAKLLVERIKAADPLRSEVVAQILVRAEGSTPCPSHPAPL